MQSLQRKLSKRAKEPVKQARVTEALKKHQDEKPAAPLTELQKKMMERNRRMQLQEQIEEQAAAEKGTSALGVSTGKSPTASVSKSSMLKTKGSAKRKNFGKGGCRRVAFAKVYLYCRCGSSTTSYRHCKCDEIAVAGVRWVSTTLADSGHSDKDEKNDGAKVGSDFGAERKAGSKPGRVAQRALLHGRSLRTRNGPGKLLPTCGYGKTSKSQTLKTIPEGAAGDSELVPQERYSENVDSSAIDKRKSQKACLSAAPAPKKKKARSPSDKEQFLLKDQHDATLFQAMDRGADGSVDGGDVHSWLIAPLGLGYSLLDSKVLLADVAGGGVFRTPQELNSYVANCFDAVASHSSPDELAHAAATIFDKKPVGANMESATELREALARLHLTVAEEVAQDWWSFSKCAEAKDLSSQFQQLLNVY
eukprot:g4413.t1